MILKKIHDELLFYTIIYTSYHSRIHIRARISNLFLKWFEFVAQCRKIT